MVRLSVPHSNTKWGFKIVATKAIPKVMLEMKENSCDSAKMLMQMISGLSEAQSKEHQNDKY